MCRDVGGAGQDLNPPSPQFPGDRHDQTYSPGYFWNNTHEGGPGEFRATNGAQNYILEGRDYFLDTSSHGSYGDGGVSSGRWADRPTCDSAKRLHGYWATDRGDNWNTTNEYGGEDGALYVCDGSGIWNHKYTPAPYPHPLISGASGTPSPTTCTSFTYSAWGECQPDNTQSRNVLAFSPSGCTGGNPVTTQSCTYTPPTQTCTSFTYSAWGQ